MLLESYTGGRDKKTDRKRERERLSNYEGEMGNYEGTTRLRKTGLTIYNSYKKVTTWWSWREKEGEGRGQPVRLCHSSNT